MCIIFNNIYEQKQEKSTIPFMQIQGGFSREF